MLNLPSNPVVGLGKVRTSMPPGGMRQMILSTDCALKARLLRKVSKASMPRCVA